jgi:uncharacterized protein
MKVVLDTNVLVSGLLTPFGTFGEIVRMLASSEIVPCVDSRILLEYDEVLRRPKFDIDRRTLAVVLGYLQHASEVHATVPLETDLPDEDDTPFLEVTLSSGAKCLVTGNLSHFPEHCRAGARVLSPKQFLEFFREHRAR